MRIFFIIIVLALFSCRENTKKDTASNFAEEHVSNSNEKVYKVPEIPSSILFADESIELKDIDLRERFDRELVVNNFWHSNTILYIKRSNRWFPLMKKIFTENEVPEDLIYLSVVESGLTNATSAAGARGFWQFMKPTAKQYGLIVDREVDERLNVEKSTQAACDYLKEAHREFDSWILAAASYNRGVQGIKNAMDHQEVSSYFDLSLNDETSRYVFRILAVKEIMKDPEKFGFHIEEDQLYPPFQTREIMVRTKIKDIADWALKHGTTLKLVRKLNPWLRGNALKASGDSPFKILIPKNNEQLGVYNG